MREQSELKPSNDTQAEITKKKSKQKLWFGKNLKELLTFFDKCVSSITFLGIHLLITAIYLLPYSFFNYR